MFVPKFYTSITLDVSCEDHPVIVPVKQLDNDTRIIYITMYDSHTGEAVPIPHDDKLTAQLNVTRPDGVLVEIPAREISQNRVTVYLTDDCLAVAGKALADLKLYEDEMVFSAASFALDVQKTATGKYSEGRGILTQANLQIITKSQFDKIAEKDINTLYLVTYNGETSLYLGSSLIIHGSSGLLLVKCTQAEYDALEHPDENTVYVIVG